MQRRQGHLATSHKHLPTPRTHVHSAQLGTSWQAVAPLPDTACVGTGRAWSTTRCRTTASISTAAITPPVAREATAVSSSQSAGTCEARCSITACSATNSVTGIALLSLSGMLKRASEVLRKVPAVAVSPALSSWSHTCSREAGGSLGERPRGARSRDLLLAARTRPRAASTPAGGGPAGRRGMAFGIGRSSTGGGAPEPMVGHGPAASRALSLSPSATAVTGPPTGIS
eukprot:9530023-Alexandrium_andersonii.AAC.2